MKEKFAPELITSQWFNADSPLSLEILKGKVIAVFAFQMLCPGCVKMSMPQAEEAHQTFHADDVAIIGLHTVFEHHAAMTPVALEAFIHEYRLTFPIGVDTPGEGGMPQTMALYGMQGTPTLILIDHKGRLRKHKFGHEKDLVLGAEIMSLVLEKKLDEGSSA